LDVTQNIRFVNLSVSFTCKLQGLTKLEELDLHSNRISSLAPISTLPCLHSLNAAANQLIQLPSLAALSCLTELNLRHNLISNLSTAQMSGPPPTAGAAAGAAGDGAAGAAGAAAGASAGSSSGLLPISLRRLSLACNQLQDAASLAGD
jgi:Leucine-rich repeat (LRR) protein